MASRSVVIFTLVSFFCLTCFVFSNHRPESLSCSCVLILATVLLLGSDSESSQLPHENYPYDINWISERMAEENGAVLFQAGLLVPSTAQDSSKQGQQDASVHLAVDAAPKFAGRSLSFHLPRKDHWEWDVLPDDDDPPLWVPDGSTVDTVDFATQITPPNDNCSVGSLEKTPSLNAEQLSALSDAFIARFHQQLRLERQMSLVRAGLRF